MGVGKCAVTTTTIQSDETRIAGQTMAVEADRLGKSIDEKPILRDLTFSIPTGQYCTLLGANGAGKSTLLNVLATLIAPTTGTLSMFGHPVGKAMTDLRGKIGMIGHNPMLYRDLSALENLVFFGRLYGVAKPQGRAEELLEFVNLTNRRHDPVKSFSRGMTQRVAIARALMHEPDMLLSDEPFAGLDAPSTAALETMLARLQGEGRTIILANHDIEQSTRLTERVLVLRAGRLVLDAPTAGLTKGTIMAEVMGS